MNSDLSLNEIGIEDVGSQPATFERRRCPDCDAMNWIVTVAALPIYNQFPETDIIHCWKCHQFFWLNSGRVKESEKNSLENSLICKGTPDPSINVDDLIVLLDAAKRQFEILQTKMKQSKTLDGLDILNQINHSLRNVEIVLGYRKDDDIPF